MESFFEFYSSVSGSSLAKRAYYGFQVAWLVRAIRI